MHIDDTHLENFILDSGLVSKKDLEAAKEISKNSGSNIGDVLVNKGMITEDDLRRMQAYLLGIPFVNLKNQKLDFSLLSLIPEPIARKHNIIAFKKEGSTLEVALLDTADLSAVDFLKKSSGLKILPRLTDGDSIKGALLSYQKNLKAGLGDLISKAPTVDLLLKHALLQRASHIHIESLEGKVLVRYRIGGRMHDAMVLPIQAYSEISNKLKELSKLNGGEEAEEGRFKADGEGEKIAVSFSILATSAGGKIVMRIARENVSGFTLEKLGFGAQDLEDVHRALSKGQGLILVIGPAKSGKTTTLYTMIDLLHTPEVNISTIEDPVEYRMNRINQHEVRQGSGVTFAHALRSVLRQDPDIVMIGELKDAETAQVALNAASRGHLVLAGITADSVEAGLQKLKDFKLNPDLLASTKKLVVRQKLGSPEVVSEVGV